MASSRPSRAARRAAAAASTVALVVGLAPAVHAQEPRDLGRSRELREEVEVGEVLEHQRALARIARANRLFGRPTRAPGTPGYDRSVRYVADTLKRAGYRVAVQEFAFPFFAADEPTLEVDGLPEGFSGKTAVFTYSGGGTSPAPCTRSTSWCRSAAPSRTARPVAARRRTSRASRRVGSPWSSGAAAPSSRRRRTPRPPAPRRCSS